MEPWSIERNTGVLEPLPRDYMLSDHNILKPPVDQYVNTKDIRIPTILEPEEAVKPGLSLWAKVLIGVSVTMAVILAIVLLVYFLVLKPDSTPSSKFGSIRIRDMVTNASISTTSPNSTVNFQPGDKLQLTYTPSSQGFSNRAVWTVSLDGVTSSISDPSFGNVVQWTVPANTFTQSAIFRVADELNLNDFVDTSNVTITIDPAFVLVKGPGLTKANDAVIVGKTVTSTVTTDLSLTNIANVFVQTSRDNNFSSYTSETIVSTTTNSSNSSIIVQWIPTAAITNVYYRVITSKLVSNGYPYELSSISNYQININAATSCVNVSPTTSFTVCNLAVIETSTGRTNNFDSGAAVTLEFAYLNTFPGTATWSYSIDGGAFTNWTTTSGPDTSTSGLVVYTAVLPTIITTNFVVKVVSGSSSSTSPPFTVDASFLIGNVNSPVLVYPTNRNIVTIMTLSVPSEIPSSWQVGFGTGNFQEASFTSPPIDGKVTVQWSFTWNDMGFTQSSQQKVFPLLFKAVFSTGSVVQSIPNMTFESAQVVVPHAQFHPFYAPNTNMCEATTFLGFEFQDPTICAQTWYWSQIGSSTTGTVCQYTQNYSPNPNDICLGGIIPDSSGTILPGGPQSTTYTIQKAAGTNGCTLTLPTATIYGDSVLLGDTTKQKPSETYFWAASPV